MALHSGHGGHGALAPPLWDSSPTTWHHYVTESKWYLKGLKPEDKALAASRMIRELLKSGSPSIKSLMYKLDPDDFSSENAIQKLLDFLEKSPMGRAPLPDAGAKLGN